MKFDEFNNAAELVAIQYITMNNIKTISERIEERTREELVREVTMAFDQVDRWMRAMPQYYETPVAVGQKYHEVRDRIVDLIVAARLPDRVDAAIRQFMKKVEDPK